MAQSTRTANEFKFNLLYSGGDATVDQLVAYMQEAWAAGRRRNGTRFDPRRRLDRSTPRPRFRYVSERIRSAGGRRSDARSSRARRISTGSISAGYCNGEWDALNETQKREFDTAVRTEQLIQQSQLIWDEQPVGPIRFGIARTGYNTRIHNFHPTWLWFPVEPAVHLGGCLIVASTRQPRRN